MKSIFVSSTFRDMHFERDVLNRTVSAKLNRHLAAYNQSVRLMDLRWGVDTSALSEEEATQRVLKVCFDTLDFCRPYIIILLGDRYGYVPGEDGLSVTHMEILRGALQNAQPEHVFIYMRQMDTTGMPEKLRSVYTEQDSQGRQRLEALKAELLQTFPSRCRSYRAKWSVEHGMPVSDEFGAMVYEDLQRDLVESLALKQYRSELHRQLSDNASLLDDRLSCAYRDQTQLQAHLEQMLSDDRPYGIIGQAGAGKSVFMSLLCASLREQGKRTCILFCGDNAFSASVRNAAEAVLYALTVASGENYDFEKNADLSYDRLLQELSCQREKATEKTYLLLDAVDQCEEGMVEFLLWCGRFLSGVLVPVFSSQENRRLTRNSQSLRMGVLNYDRPGLEAMANSLLKQYGKTMNGTLIQALCQKVSTPLQLHILLLRLLNFNVDDFAAIETRGGGMDAINAHLRSLIDRAPADEQELLADYLLTLLKHTEHGDFMLTTLSFLVFSDRGLSENDLQNLMGFTQVSWVQMDYLEFLEQMAFLIRIRENGRLDISHDMIRRVCRRLMAGQQRAICGVLADYFFAQEDPTPEQVAAFFSAAGQGGLARRVVEYVVKHSNSFHTVREAENLRARQMCKSMAELYLRDNGVFLGKSVNSCKSAEDVGYFQGALSGSFSVLHDYLPSGTIMKIVQLWMAIPVKLDIFPAELARMELLSCEKFVQRHKVTDPEVLEFLEQCRQQIDLRGRAMPTDPEQMLSLLRDDSADVVERMYAMEKLTAQAKQQAKNPKKPEQTRALLMALLEIALEDRLSLGEDIQKVALADLYTALGALCKSTRQWEAGIEWDQKSEQIYRQIYERTPTPDMFRKYRERVYNVANIIEAWALEQKDDPALWERTRQEYERVYELSMQAVAHGISERELVFVGSSIVSYGIALCNCGDLTGGLQKFREGIQLVQELTANNPRPELYVELCLNQLEGAYQLCLGQRYDVAYELCRTVRQSAEAVVAQGDQTHQQTLRGYVVAFCNRINEIQAQAAKLQDLDAMLMLYRIATEMYSTLLPMKQADAKVNLMVAKRNISGILLKQGKYEEAYQACCQLLEAVREQDLAGPGENGRFNDRLTLSLAAVLVRSLQCLEKLGKTQQIKELLDQLPDWARYIASRTGALSDDPARILYMMSGDLAQQGSQLSPLLIMLAFHAIQEEGYDVQKHKNTVTLIMNALGQLGVT